MLEIVCATRARAAEFWESTALGASLRRLAWDKRLSVHVAFENRRGLPEVYNERIESADPALSLVFLHDDVWIDDYYFSVRVLRGLENFDLLGVAGNRRRRPGQPAWLFKNVQREWDHGWLSGGIGHGRNPCGAVSMYGPVPAACELLDGVLLGARIATLRQHGLRFDTRFDFHFYDMDFCRTARDRGLKLGTWPVCLTHQSGGHFGNEAWQRACAVYFAKWGEAVAQAAVPAPAAG